MLRAAIKRFVTVLVGAIVVTSVLSLLAGLALGSGAGRSISVGLYLVGCFLLVSGFFLGSRGPVRLANEESLVGFRRPRVMRTAGFTEQADSINGSALMVVIGVVILVVAIAVDARVELI